MVTRRVRGQMGHFVVLFAERLLLLYFLSTRSKGLQGQILQPFFAGWRCHGTWGSAGASWTAGNQGTDQEKQSNSNVASPSRVGVAHAR